MIALVSECIAIACSHRNYSDNAPNKSSVAILQRSSDDNMMLCSADFQSGVHAAEDRTFIITIWDLRLDLDLKNDFFAP